MVQLATRLGFIPYDHYDEALAKTIEPEDLNVDRQKARLF